MLNSWVYKRYYGDNTGKLFVLLLTDCINIWQEPYWLDG